MATAHVEALRLENHFLKQSLCEKKSDEKEVNEMQKQYHHVLDLTEVTFGILIFRSQKIITCHIKWVFNFEKLKKENKRLKSEVVTLTQCIESLKDIENSKYKSSKHSNNKNNNHLNIELEQR